jgi:hypothetical protein
MTTSDLTSTELAVIDTAALQVSSMVTLGWGIIDITLNADGTAIYLVPYTLGGCAYIHELDAANFAEVGVHEVIGKPSRAIYDGQRFQIISTDLDTFFASRYTTADGDIAPSYLTLTGDNPYAVGNFISPMRTPIATPEAMMFDFGQVALNGSAIHSITVTNTGNLPLKTYLTTVDASVGDCVSGPCDPGLDASAFSIIGDSCAGNTVAVDASCAVTVQYTPTDNHLFSGTLRLHTNSDESGLAISLTGDVLPSSVSTPSSEVPPVTSAVSDDDGNDKKGGGGSSDLIDLFVLMLAYFAFALVARRKHLVGGMPV